MTRYRFSLVILIAALPLLGPGCPCPPNPDPEEEPFCVLLETLTEAAFGTQDLRPPPPRNSCPKSIVCDPPVCIRADDNGGFEVPSFHELLPLHKWYGDETDLTAGGCLGQALSIQATTPDGPSASASAQVYQVIDYKALVPPAARATTRRVRVQAAFQAVTAHPDRQFGVRVDVYAGDPAAFPRTGDPETFARDTDAYSRLDSVEVTRLHDGFWEPLGVELMLPDNADFFVVLLEAYEDAQNDSTGDEFPGFYEFDDVRVAIDAGNTPPLTRPDYPRTAQDTPVDIAVLMNDWDQTSYIDAASIAIVGLSAFGTATPNPNGTVTFVPDLGFVGTAAFTYTVADEEGLRSDEALVTVEVVNTNDAPVAVDDVYELPESGLLIVPGPIGVLANDTDPDGDTLTAVLVDDVTNGSLTLDPTGAFTYQAGSGFPGEATFTYRASDGIVESNTATVTIRGEGGDGNQPPVANDDAATATSGMPVVIDVLANDTDPDGTLDPATVTVVSSPSNGSALVNADGTIRYTSEPGFPGTDSFTYTVQDNDGATSNEAIVTMTVSASGIQYNLQVFAQASNDVYVVDQEDLVFFNVLVGNQSLSHEAQGVEVITPLPAGFTYLSHEPASAPFDPNTGVWQIGTVSCCAYVTLRIYARAPSEVGTYTHVATLTGGLTYDTDPADNEDEVTVTVQPPGTGSQ